MKSFPSVPRLPAFACLLSLLASSPEAQISYKELGTISMAQRILPSTGAGSAFVNPAALSEARWGHLQAGNFNTLSGKAGYGIQYYSVSLPSELLPILPFGVSAGFGLSDNGSRIDNSNAVYREGVRTWGFAVSTDPKFKAGKAAVGLSFPTYEYNAFGALRSRSDAMDLGLLLLANHATGAYRAAFVRHNYRKPSVRLPDDRGEYTIPGWMEFSMGWMSPAKGLRLFWEQYLEDERYSREGPNQGSRLGVNAWEIELRPHPWAGLKVEKTRLGNLSSLGLVFNPVLGPRKAEIHAEANIGHDKFGPPPLDWIFGQGEDEGRGWQLGFVLGGGI